MPAPRLATIPRRSPNTLRLRAPRLAAAVAMAIAALAAPARAAESRPPDARPAAPEPWIGSRGSVRAGETVEVQWADPGTDCEELEILLSVDGGRRFPIRISPEMGGRETSFRWRVPNLAAGDARLRLRARLRGREVESAAGRPFEILADPARPADLRQVHEGAWWEGLGSGSAPAAGLGPDGQSGLQARTRGADAESPSPPLAATPAPARLLPRRPENPGGDDETRVPPPPTDRFRPRRE